MLPFSFRKIGYFVLILSFILFLSIALNFSYFCTSVDAWVGIFKWIGLGGLVLVTVSKEKNETPEIERLRFHCFFRNFFGILLIIIVFSLSNLFFTHDKVSVGKALEYLKDNDVSKFSIIFLAAHFFAFRNELRKMDNMP